MYQYVTGSDVIFQANRALELIELKPFISLLPFMYSTKSRPSKRYGTLGYELRLGIAALKLSGEHVEATGDISYKVQEYFEANKKELRNDGIFFGFFGGQTSCGLQCT